MGNGLLEVPFAEIENSGEVSCWIMFFLRDGGDQELNLMLKFSLVSINCKAILSPENKGGKVQKKMKLLMGSHHKFN